MMDELDGTITEALGLLWGAFKRKFDWLRPRRYSLGLASEHQQYFDEVLLAHASTMLFTAEFGKPKPFPAHQGATKIHLQPKSDFANDSNG